MSPEETKAYLERLRKERAAKQPASTFVGPKNYRDTPVYKALAADAESATDKPLSADEFDSLLEQLRQQNAALKAAEEAQAPAAQAPKVRNPVIEKLRAERAARPPATSAATTLSITPEEGKILAKQTEFTQAAAEQQAAATKLRNELALKYANAPMTEEEKRNKIETEMSDIAQPLYVGGFEGPIRPYGTVSPSIIPEGAKAAEGISGAGSVLEVLRPKVEIPKTAEAASVDYPFDDIQFNESIKNLSKAEQAQSRASYNAFKKVYDKYRGTFPSISSGGILDIVKQKIQDIPNKQVVFNPVAGGYENPLLRAVQTQGTTGTLYDLDEIQSDYFKEVAKELIPYQTEELRKQLAARTKTESVRDRSGNVVSSRQVALTPQEIEAEVQRKLQSGEIGGTEIFTDKEKMREFVKDPSKFATRTYTGGLEFPGGATIESPAMWFVRAATALPNAIAATVGYGLGTAVGVQEAREAGREEKYKPAGEGVVAGLASNVAANLAEAGGYAKELADVVKYNPDPSINKYENVARIAGTVVDVLGVGDIAPIAGVAGAARGAIAGRAATAAAGVKGIERLQDITTIAAKTGAADYLNSLPLMSKMAEKVGPADLRITYGSRLADEIDAIDKFRKAYQQNLKSKILSKQMAFNNALSHIDPKSRLRINPETSFFNKIKGLTVDEAIRLTDDTLASIGDFRNYDEISSAVSDWSRGIDITSAQQKLISPYVRRAGMVSTDTGKLLTKFADEIKGTVGRVDLNRASPDVRAGLANTIKDFARLDVATKQIDDALSASGLKGNQLKALTRNVIASEDVIDKTIKQYKDSAFYKRVVEPQKQIVNAVYDGNVELAYQVSGKMKDFVEKFVTASRIDNKLTESEGTRIAELLAQDKITAGDLKLLSELQIEAIALNRGALSKTALATEGLLPTATSQQLRVSVAQEKRLQELTRDTPVLVNRFVQKWNEVINPIKNLVTPYQKSLIDNAMREMGALAKRLKSEVNRIDSDSEFAALYGVTKDSSIEEKILALARGAYATADEASKAAVSPVFIDELLKSMLFGANRNKLLQAFSPGYDFGMDVLDDTAEFVALREKLLDYTPQRISSELEDIAEELSNIVRNNTNQKLKEVSGVEAFAVSKDRVKEVAVTVYGRMKANEIKAKTLNQVLEETTFELSNASIGLKSQFKKSGIPQPDKMNKILYSLIALDSQFPWIDRLISDPISVDPVGLSALFKNAMDSFGIQTFNNDQIASALSRILRSEASRSVEEIGQDIVETGTSRGILEDLQISRQKLIENNTISNQQIYKVLKRLADGKLDINQYASPGLVNEFQKSLGLNANYNNMLRELAILSQQANEGVVTAFNAARRIDQLIGLYHTTFYNAVLYVRPSFHVINNFSAPLMQSYSTGRIPVLADVMRGNMPGALWTKSAQIVTEASSMADPVIRNRIAVIDKFGNTYTYGQMHDLAISKGLFVTRANAELSSSFLSDVDELFKGPLKKYASQANILSREFAGSEFASFTDRAWRMTSVIDGLQEGKTLDEAFELGRKSLYDYNNVTDFERRFVSPFARRAFVFYSFRRQAIGQFMGNLASNPARVIRMMRLAKDTSDVMIGDQNTRDLSFYFDPNMATSTIVLKMKPAATRNQGEIVSTFALPTQDGINFAAAVISNPVGFLLGSEFPAKEGRSFEGTMIAEMLSPVAKIALAIGAGKSIVSSQKMMKNYIPPEHMVLFRLAGTDATVMNYFDVKVVDSTDKENSLDGKSFYIDDKNFDSYKAFVVAAETSGFKSAMTYYGRLIGSPSLSGAYPKTAPEFLGITPRGGAQIKEAAQTRAMQEQTKEFGQETESVESYRFR